MGEMPRFRHRHIHASRTLRSPPSLIEECRKTPPGARPLPPLRRIPSPEVLPGVWIDRTEETCRPIVLSPPLLLRETWVRLPPVRATFSKRTCLVAVAVLEAVDRPSSDRRPPHRLLPLLFAQVSASLRDETSVPLRAESPVARPRRRTRAPATMPATSPRSKTERGKARPGTIVDSAAALVRSGRTSRPRRSFRFGVRRRRVPPDRPVDAADVAFR